MSSRKRSPSSTAEPLEQKENRPAFRETSGSTGDEVSRDVEEVRERVYGPDGTTRRGERITRRVHIERDPNPGYLRKALSLIGRLLGSAAMAYLVVIGTAGLAGTVSPWVLAPIGFAGLYLATRIWSQA